MTLLMLLVPETSIGHHLLSCLGTESTTWNVGWRHLLLWIAVPAIIWLLAELTVQLQIPAKQ